MLSRPYGSSWPPQVGKSVPQAVWAPPDGLSGVPSPSVPAMYPPTTMVASTRNAAMAAVTASPSLARSVSGCEPGFAARYMPSRKARRIIAIPKCTATRTECRLCSTVSPPRTAWASTRPTVNTDPRINHGRSRRLRKACQARSRTSTATNPASTRWVNSTRVAPPTEGITRPVQSGHPSRPLPAGPQPRPDSLTLTMPPTTIRAKVANAVVPASRRKRVRASAPDVSSVLAIPARIVREITSELRIYHIHPAAFHR